MSTVVAVPMPSDLEWCDVFVEAGIDVNPVPGNLTGIDQCRQWYDTTARELGDHAHQLRQAKNPSESTWKGDTASKFVHGIGDSPQKLEALATRFSHIAQALKEYIPELEAAQRKAVDAYWKAKGDPAKGYPPLHDQLVKARQSSTEVASHPEVNQGMASSPTMKPQVQQLQDKYDAVVRQIRQAESDRDAAANRCADRIDQAGQDVLTDPWKTGAGWLGDLNAWAHDLAKNLSNWACWVGVIAGAIALVCALIPPLTLAAPIFAGIAVIAGWVGLIADLYLVLANHDESKSWLDIGVDVIGILPLGKIFKMIKAADEVDRIAKLAAPRISELTRQVAHATEETKNFASVAPCGSIARDAARDLAKAEAPVVAAKEALGKLVREEFLGTVKPPVLEDMDKALQGLDQLVDTAKTKGFGAAAKEWGAMVSKTWRSDVETPGSALNDLQYAAGVEWNVISGQVDSMIYGNPDPGPSAPWDRPAWN